MSYNLPIWFACKVSNAALAGSLQASLIVYATNLFVKDSWVALKLDYRQVAGQHIGHYMPTYPP